MIGQLAVIYTSFRAYSDYDRVNLFRYQNIGHTHEVVCSFGEDIRVVVDEFQFNCFFPMFVENDLAKFAHSVSTARLINVMIQEKESLSPINLFAHYKHDKFLISSKRYNKKIIFHYQIV